MSDFANTFKSSVFYAGWWTSHCSSNENDCTLHPSSILKSEVRGHFPIDNDEDILFIRDTSFWNSRDQGTVLTDKCLYLIPDNEKPDERIVFAWQDITKVTYNDATIYFWTDDNINNAYAIHITWFLKNADEAYYHKYGMEISNVLNKCAETAIDPVQKAWDEMSCKYESEKDPHKKIGLIEKMQSEIPSDTWAVPLGYAMMGDIYYFEIHDFESAFNAYRTAILHDQCEYGNAWFGELCYKASSAIDLGVVEKNVNDYGIARQYALMGARFADNEKKHSTKHGTEVGEATSREDAAVDFNRFNDEYTEHFLELPYKDRKTLLIVDAFDNLFQNHFVTLYIDSDLSKLTFPTGHPKVNEVYVAHPLTTNRYMPIEDYQLELIEDKVREFCELAQGLGATEINIECLNSNSNDSSNSGNRNLSGGASRRSSIHASGHDEYSQRLIEEISRSVSLHQTFQPHKAPALPTNLMWYDGEPSWQRLYRQRMEGGLLTHEERIETKKSQVVDNREMKEIKGELEALFANMDVAFDKTEEAKFEQQENAVLAISVKFAPLSQLTGETASTPQTSQFTGNEQKYIDEVKECLADGEITRTGRRLLNMQRERLGISEARAAELESSLSTPQLTDEEKEYLEAYRESCEDGQISEKERRMLNRLRNMLGITEERAKEIEK